MGIVVTMILSSLAQAGCGGMLGRSVVRYMCAYNSSALNNLNVVSKSIVGSLLVV
jgi:hypothetical protein